MFTGLGGGNNSVGHYMSDRMKIPFYFSLFPLSKVKVKVDRKLKQRKENIIFLYKIYCLSSVFFFHQSTADTIVLCRLMSRSCVLSSELFKLDTIAGKNLIG